MSLYGVEADVTQAEQYELDRLVRDISKGTNGRYTPDDYPWLADVARRCAADMWRRETICHLCPRNGEKHVCSCPHRLARKRLTAYGVWPDA